MSLQLFLCLCLIGLVYSDCVILSVNPSGPPVPANTTDDKTPKPYGLDWTGTIACPEFQYTNSCCTANLNLIQATNFGQLTSAFGNTGGGCDVCAANLIRFFCYYSCSPDQDQFMTFGGYKNVTITNDDNQLETINVAVVNVSVNADMACGVYQSCTKVSFMTEISAGSSALGFITFLFDRGTSRSYTKDYVTINNTGGLAFNNSLPHSCNETFVNGTDQYGYQIPGNCSCNYCSDSCSPLTMITYGGLTDGFNLRTVIITYIVTVGLTILCVFYKAFSGYKAKRSSKNLHRDLIEDARRESIESNRSL